VIRLDKPVAVEGPALVETDWQHVLRLGPVVDTTTGKEVVSITPDLCAELAKAHKAIDGRMRTPIDHNHGLLSGKTPESKRTYGHVADVEAREDGLYVKLALNEGGQSWVKDNKGNAYLSPTLFPDLYDPEKAGEKLASAYLMSVSLTPLPRQTRLPEVALSRGGDEPQRAVALARLDSRGDLRIFEDALRARARLLFLAEGTLDEEWLGLDDWQGDESGTAVLSWYREHGGSQVRRVQWTRDAAGVVTVQGPSVPVVAVITYETISPAAQAAIPMSRAVGPKEAPMPGSTSGAGTAPSSQPFAVLLSRVPDEARPEVEKALGDLAARAAKAEAELADKATALSRAEATAATREETVVELSRRVGELEAKRKEAEKAETERTFAEFFQSDIVALGRGATDAATRTKWRSRFDVLGLAECRSLAADIPVGAVVPVALSRAPGIAGVGGEDPEVRGARLDTEARSIQQKALAAGQNLSFQAAYEQAEKGGGR
jgi:hypothetical protein